MNNSILRKTFPSGAATFGILTGIVISFGSVPSAQASPAFSIGAGGSMTWTQGISQNLIRVANNPLEGFAAQEFYNTQIGMNMFGTPVQSIANASDITLTPDISVFNPGGQLPAFNSLVMSWNNSNSDNPNVLNVAAWDYVYQDDPDLTNTWIKFSLRPPQRVWDFSLELFDSQGRSRGWFGNPTSPDWSMLMISPDIQEAQGFGYFYNQPGFDITRVTRIRLNESTQGGVLFTEVNPVTGLNRPWNAWNSLEVKVHVPEPTSTLSLLALGTLGAVSTLKRKLKPSQSTEKETTKVG